MICAKMGLSEKYVYEELSLIRVYQYVHCIKSERGESVGYLNDDEDIAEHRAKLDALNAYDYDLNIEEMEEFF